MKKIALLITIVAMASCKQEDKEVSKYKTPDEIVNEAARPSIAKEMGELDFNVMTARDTTRDTIYRSFAIDKIRREQVEYLYSATIENIFSTDFEERLEAQKKLIIINRRQIERNKQYKQLVIEQFKN